MLLRKILWVLLTAVTFFFVFTLDRIYLFAKAGVFQSSNAPLLKTVLLGARFDLREVGILAAAMLLLGLIPLFNPFKSKFGRKFWLVLLSVFSVVTIFLDIADALHFDYLLQRLNANILNFVPEGSSSTQMLWQSYPVVKLSLLLLCSCALLVYCHVLILNTAGKSKLALPKKWGIASWATVFLLSDLCIFGRVDQYPLRWSDAFSLGDSKMSQLALNPLPEFYQFTQF